jgi:hypothetical protein
MSRRKLLVLLSAVVALGIGAIVVRAEFAGNVPLGANSVSSRLATHDLTAQQRAERRSEQEAIKADCAALRKMGTTDKLCKKH